MEQEEETRELLLPSWQGSTSHGITIDQTDAGVFVRRVQHNSPAARMGVVREGDQIVGATVYFDNLQSGEVAQLLSSMGHHTLGLRLQRKGDRSPLPGQTWGHDVFVPSSPEVVLSGDDEEYRRIYTTKIKPRLKSEELAEPDGGGTQSRTITVTRKVTAYTVDVTAQDGCQDADVLGPEFRIRVPSRDVAHGTTGGESATSVIKMAPGEAPPGPTVGSSTQKLDVKPGIGVSGVEMRTRVPQPPQSQVPGGETGKWVAVELPGRDVSGPAFPGSPAFEANGQTGHMEMGFHIKGPGLDGKGHIYGAAGRGEMLGDTRAPAVDVALPAVENPELDVGKIKIPVLKMPKFGFPGAGSGADAQAPCADVASSSVRLPAPQVPAPSAQVPMPQVDVGLKGDAKVPSPQLEVPGVAIKGPDVAIKGPGAALPPPDTDVHDEKIKLKIPHMTYPKFTAPSAQGDGPTMEATLPKAEVAPAPCDVAVGITGQGEWKGPAFKKVETPHISLSDVNLNLKGPQAKGDLGVAVPRMEVKVPAGESVKGPGVTAPELDVKVKGDASVSVPKMDLKGPQLDVKGPKLGVDVPDVDVKGPKVTMPGVHVQTPQISMPDIDLNLKGPKVKGELDVSAPKLEGELKGPGLDVKGPKVDIEAPDVDIHGLEGKVKIPKLKMPKFGVPSMKGEGPDVDVTLPKGQVDISGPKVDVDVPSVAIEGPEGKGKGLKLKMPGLNVQTPKLSMPDVDLALKNPHLKGEAEISAPKVSGDLKGPKLDVEGPKVDVDLPDVDLECPEGKAKGSKFRMPKLNIKAPKISVPDVDLNLKGHKMKGEVDVSLPKVEGDVKGPKIDVEVPDVNLECPEAKLKAPKVKLPHFNVSGAKLEGADIDVNLPKAEVDVSGPEVDIEAPELDVAGPEGKWKGPKFRMPKLNIKTPKISMPDVDLNLKGPKAKGELDIAAPKVEVKGPEIDVKGPKVDVEAPNIDLECPEGKLKGPKFKMPEMHVKAPKISMPDVDIGLKGPKIKGDVDVSGPKLEGPDVEIKGPKVDIDVPDVDVHGPEGKFKMPKFKMPKFGIPGFKGEGPEVDVNLPKGDIEVSGPKVDIEGPELDIEGPEGKLKGPKFKMPEMHIKTPKISMPDIDLNLKGPKVKGDVDVSLPKLEGDLKGPELDIKGPKVDIDVPDVDVHGPEGKFKLPKFKMPKFGVPGFKGEGPEVDVNLPKGDIDISGPTIDVQVPDLNVDGKAKGPKFALPELHIKAPKISIPDVDFNIKGPQLKGDVDISAPKLEGDLNAPQIDVKTPKVDVTAPDVTIEGPEGKLKGPKFKMPEMHIKAPKFSMPDVDFNLKGPKVKGDVDISVPKLEGDLKGPDIDIKGPKVDIDLPDVELEGPEGKLKGPKFKMPEMHVKTPQISMPDIDLNLKGLKLKGDADLHGPKLEGGLKGPEIDIKGPKMDIEGPEVDVDGLEGKVKIPKMKLPKFGLKGEGPDVDVNLAKAEVELSGPKVDIGVPDVSVEGPEGKVKGPKVKMPEMHMNIPKISMPEIDLNLKGHKTKGTFEVSSPKMTAELKGPDVELKGPEVDVECPDLNVEGPEANVKLPKFKKPKFGFGMKSPKVEIKVPGAEVDLAEPELNVESPDANVAGKGKKSKFKMPKLHMSGPKVKGKKGGFDVNVAGGDVDVGLKSPELELNVAGPDVTVKGDAAVKSPKGKKPMFGKISIPDVEFDLKSHRFKGDASATLPKMEGELKAPGVEVSAPTVKGPSLDVAVEAPDVNVKKPKFKLPGGDLKVEGGLKGAAVGVAVPSVAVPGVDVNAKGPKVKGEVTAPGAELEGPDGKLKLGLGLETPGAKLDVSAPSLDVDLKGPRISGPALEGNLKGPKIAGDLDVSGSFEGPNVNLDLLGGLGGKMKLPKMDVDADRGVNVNLSAPTVAIKGPGVDVSPPDLNLDLKGPKLKGDLDVQPPEVSPEAPDAAFQILGGTIKLPSLKLPQFSVSSPGVNGADLGVHLEGPQVKGDLGVGVGLEGPAVELKGPQFQPSPGVSSPDVELKLKGPNVDGAGETQGPKVTVEAHGVAPAVSGSGFNADIKGPKIKSGTATKWGTGGPGAPADYAKITFPKLRIPKFVFSDPETKGREMGVDVEFPGGDAEAEVEEPDARLKKPKLKMPKFTFSKQKAKGGGSLEASGSVSGSKPDLKSSKASLGSTDGETEAAKGVFAIFKPKKPRHRSASLSDEGPDGADRGKAPKFGTFGGIGSRSRGSYEVTGSDEEAEKRKKTPLPSSSSSSDGGTKAALDAPKKHR